ncbi:MAG: phosphonate C-P lyase system protein PhnG [Treponema sp.]|jgi:alpha-D-ribose 1-methylphosphonate 5-triphosphate synthase subunit PhnG|nr:phosphonate C-P lyase system protein PhnG [Treponema sp.]
MDKLALSRICAFADPVLLKTLAEKAAAGLKVILLKGPEKTIVLLQSREPVQHSRFYLGELLAAHCVVEIAGVRGAAVQMGDDLDKARAAAILDAAHTGRFPCFAQVEPELLRLETERKAALAKEAAEIWRTRVSFEALEDREL